MSKLSHDQKRKAKLAKRAAKEAQRGLPAEATPYEGSKYKTPEMTPFFTETEFAIHSADVVTGRTLTDRHITEALTQLILQLRAGSTPPIGDEPIEYGPSQETELIIRMTRDAWRAPSFPRFPLQDLIGGLRTLLNSVRVWTARGSHSRGYLSFVEGFLRRMGLTARFETSPGHNDDQPVDELLDLGREWCETGSADIARSFRQEFDKRITAGRNHEAVNICQQLIGEYGEGPQIRALTEFSMLAQRHSLPALDNGSA